MIPLDRLVLLDTSVLMHVARGKAAGAWMMRQFALGERHERPLVSVVSEGEMLRMAHRNGWGAARLDRLQSLVAELVVIGLEPGVVRKYGELGAHLDGAGAPIPQNDVWIAATAAAKKAVLLTTDSDFDRLHPGRVERVYIDPATLPRD